MIHQVDFTGKSGAVYRYRALEQDRFVPPAGANYVIARLRPRGVEILLAGETDNLAARTWSDELEAARAKYADATILTRLNVRIAVREFEREDLVEAHLAPVEHRDAA
jgi:hypothetical protein